MLYQITKEGKPCKLRAQWFLGKQPMNTCLSGCNLMFTGLLYLIEEKIIYCDCITNFFEFDFSREHDFPKTHVNKSRNLRVQIYDPRSIGVI